MKEQENNEKKRDQQKKPMTKLHKAKLITAYALGALLIASLVLVGKFIYDIKNPAQLFESEPAPAQAEPVAAPTQVITKTADEPEPTPTPEPTPNPLDLLISQADLDFMKNRVNILMLGLDESEERANWGSFRTDTMILVSVDFDNNTADLISIPRDSFVKIVNSEGSPTGKFGKVNSAFPSGGGAQKNGYLYAMNTISYLLGGIPINYYVGFNMNVVKDVVNAMGGVYYDVDVEVRMNGRELNPGYQYMDGQAVLDYCRQRKGSSDIERVDRQQRMLMSIFSQAKSTGKILKIPSIYQAVEQNIQTNLSFKQISALALVASRMGDAQLRRHMIEGEFMNLYKTSYWGVHTSKIARMVEEVFGISVNIDSEVSAGNVRAQVEANRALIAAELSAAYTAINKADSIIATYGANLSEDVLKNLKTAKDLVENAYDQEDKALLDAYTPQLVNWNNYALSLLGNTQQYPQAQSNQGASGEYDLDAQENHG